MRRQASSWARLSTSLSTPALAAAYTLHWAPPRSPAWEEIMVIDPPSGSSRAAARPTRKPDTTLASRAWRSAATSRSATRPMASIPAAWTTSVTGPPRRAAAPKASSAAFSWVRSKAETPLLASRSTPDADAPAPVKAAATARPMAPPAPVTRTCRPARSSGPGSLDKLHHHFVGRHHVDGPEALPVAPGNHDRLGAHGPVAGRV